MKPQMGEDRELTERLARDKEGAFVEQNDEDTEETERLKRLKAEGVRPDSDGDRGPGGG